jgi:hypothetical protein
MDMRHSWVVAAFLTSAFLLASCASTPTTRSDVIGTWKADNYDRKLSNFLVISLSDEPGMRGKVESILAGRLKKEGLHAVASSDIMPADEEINRKTVKAAMAGKGFDGVLVSRLLGVERSAVYVPPSPDTTFDSSLNGIAPIVTSPGYVEHRSVISLQIDLYDTASKHLVWSLMTQTVNPDNVTDMLNNLADAVVTDLRTKGLI